MIETADIDALALFAEELADAARGLALAYFRTPLDVERKGDLSPVTVADRAIEAELRRRIADRFPEDGILGEEMGARAGSGRLWVIDPIDGTKSFITGMPLFGTLIAVLDAGRPVVGVIDMPALDERWVGRPGDSRFNGRPARVSGCARLAEARVYTSSPDFFDARDWPAYDRLSRSAGLRRFGGDCYQYGLLASGFCDLVVEGSLQPYDYLALVPVIEAAGGCVTDWSGRPLTTDSDGRVVAAASRPLLEEALAFLRET